MHGLAAVSKAGSGKGEIQFPIGWLIIIFLEAGRESRWQDDFKAILGTELRMVGYRVTC